VYAAAIAAGKTETEATAIAQAAYNQVLSQGMVCSASQPPAIQNHTKLTIDLTARLRESADAFSAEIAEKAGQHDRQRAALCAASTA
jgi:tRNA-binding EMAP/Myf-like protein